jgi:hypothetical protein
MFSTAGIIELHTHMHERLDLLLRHVATLLARFATTHGKPGLYHETITWAFLLLIRERMARTGHQQTWTEFVACNKDLLSWKENILNKYYHDETLHSDLARSTFLFPDKISAQP